MITPITDLIDQYAQWLRASTRVVQVGDAFEITTPFLDRHNDHIQIYVKQEDHRTILSDDGYIIADLRMSGCGLDTEHRKRLLASILNGFGVTRDGDELTAIAHNGDFAQRKHSLIQAMLAVGDLFATAQSLVKSLFLEDVAAFLDGIGARAFPDFQLIGKSGFQHKFDFAIPKSEKAPERLVRAVNRPTKDVAGSLIFAWTDTRIVRSETSTMYAVLNDAETPVSGEIVDALRKYDIAPIPWSERAKYRRVLAA
ncbi:MAG TPA: DUF1829 domain-containing protein [Tepidisphaeraceae bacterium]|jgi:hypothetical protein|nr:DUF1829 domain-containing protein [Tepidisphaeraceae bacterium]